MITGLLTPLILATAPTIVDVDTTAKYNHEKQMIEARLEDKPVGITYNSTQTFDRQGRPYDNDAD